MNVIIPVENGDVLEALRGFLRRLMEAKVIDALFVPLETADGMVLPALVQDPDLLKLANPLAPIMSINGARAISELTGKQAPAQLGAVLRACEIRALVELVKLQQASLEKVTLIGLDCAGTSEPADYRRHWLDDGASFASYLAAASRGEPFGPELYVRQACQMCVQPTPELADIRVHLFGADLAQGIPVTVKDEIAAALGLIAVEEAPFAGYQAAAEKWIAAHQPVREKELAGIRAQMQHNGGFAGLFTDCIRCHNCMTACPICYCKTCLFRSTALHHEPEVYYKVAARKGALRLLEDTLLFHLTRLNHMSVSCVNCGMCSAACPEDIPVGVIFSAIGEQVQHVFEYSPGRDSAEALPLITFQANEWSQVGDAK